MALNDRYEVKGHAYFLAEHIASHLVYCALDEGSKGILWHMSQEGKRKWEGENEQGHHV
jgi:hypothetical protein